MRFPTIAAAIAFVEEFATRPATERDTVPPQARQAARFPDMLALLHLLGNPQDRLRVAHVTGTSGKGSTATMLASILRANGQHVGLYTNPYVIAPQERVQIDGAFISDSEFMACAEIVADALAHLAQMHPERHPHLKQVWVALMLVAFVRARVDVAVVEVGMGGRFDETNVVQPAITIITNIGFDHMEFLGDTLAAIAWHKAGIIKAGAPVVSGVTQPDLAQIIRDEAALTNAPVCTIDQDFGARLTLAPCVDAQQDRTTSFTYWDARGVEIACAVPLLGAHQARNAALAICAARQLVPTLPENKLHEGLAAAWLPGRFEIVATQPTVVLDVAHNPDKMRALVATLQETLQWRTIWVIFGALGTKEIAPMLGALAPLQPRFIATAPTVAGRIAQTVEAIADHARAQGIADVTTALDPAQAVDLAMHQATPEDVVVITGSLFLVSALRCRWRGHTQGK